MKPVITRSTAKKEAEKWVDAIRDSRFLLRETAVANLAEDFLALAEGEVPEGWAPRRSSRGRGR